MNKGTDDDDDDNSIELTYVPSKIQKRLSYSAQSKISAQDSNNPSQGQAASKKDEGCMPERWNRMNKV